MIIQTKVRPFADPEEFRKTLETSLANLDLEYIDLFGFHGINRPEVRVLFVSLVCLFVCLWGTFGWVPS